MYQQTITHRCRAAFVIAIDCSISMQNWTLLHNNTKLRKSEAAALIANYTIDELLLRATRYNEVRDYYDVAIIGYSGDGVESMLPGNGDGFIHINRLAEYEPQPFCFHINQQCDDGRVVDVPLTLHQWVKPTHCGTTPMYQAMSYIKSMVSDWCLHPDNRNSFPPIVINISDGGCSDAEDKEISDIAHDIQQLSTRHGNILFFNIYLSSLNNEENPCVIFPVESNCTSDDADCRMLFNMSSTLPQELESVINEMYSTKGVGPYKCFAQNASICELFTMMDIGTEGFYSIKHR